MVMKPSSSRPESSRGTITTMDNPPTHSRSTSGEMIATERGPAASADGPVMPEEMRCARAPQPGAAMLLAAALGVLAGCRPAPPPPWHEEAGYRWRELQVPRGKPGFTRMAVERTGIGFRNTVSDSALLGNRILGQGAGVCLGDVDGDGMVDVFLARTEGPNALYRNLGGWRFADITASAGVATPDRYSTGCALDRKSTRLNSSH